MVKKRKLTAAQKVKKRKMSPKIGGLEAHFRKVLPGKAHPFKHMQKIFERKGISNPSAMAAWWHMRVFGKTAAQRTAQMKKKKASMK